MNNMRVISNPVKWMGRGRLVLAARRQLSLLVKNTGSTARDHLANERTFLAWSKTGLGFLGGLLSPYII